VEAGERRLKRGEEIEGNYLYDRLNNCPL